ncbi:MAG TPA: hypothetical protein VH274_05345 [Mycobacteriales bacterium]|jgi:hypothetical protein|nr:hypothetical protein [Mycobacteriales bacterium]
MQRSEADETLDHLHEVLDERFEAGPADYVISHAIAQATGPDAWAIEVVYTPQPGAALQGLRLTDLGGRTAVEAAWEIYRRLEGEPSDEANATEGVVWTNL